MKSGGRNRSQPTFWYSCHLEVWWGQIPYLFKSFLRVENNRSQLIQIWVPLFLFAHLLLAAASQISRGSSPPSEYPRLILLLPWQVAGGALQGGSSLGNFSSLCYSGSSWISTSLWLKQRFPLAFRPRLLEAGIGSTITPFPPTFWGAQAKLSRTCLYSLLRRTRMGPWVLPVQQSLLGPVT